MKFTVSMADKRIKTMFSFAGDYVDIYVGQKSFIMYASVADLIVVLRLPINTIQDFAGEQLLRLPKAGFFNLWQEGLVSFVCDNDLVLVRIENSRIVQSAEFPRQICDTVRLDEAMEILAVAQEYPVMKMHDLVAPTRLLSSSQLALTVSDKIAFSTISNLQLYAKTQCGDCAVFPSVLNHLFKVCNGDWDHIYHVRDRIVYTDGMCSVLINKAPPSGASDIHHILKQPVTYRVHVNFEQAIQLLSRIRNYTEVDLNLRQQELILYTKDGKYSTRIFLEHDEQKEEFTSLDDVMNASHTEVPTVNFPAEVFRDIVFATKTKSLDLVCTKHFVRVSLQQGLMFVTRRE